MPFGTEPFGVPTYGEGVLVPVVGRPQLRFEIAPLPPTQVPAESDWLDFTSLARNSITINRGRERGTEDFSPGAFTGWLESTTRDFDPSNEESPYFAWLKPGVWLRLSATQGYFTYRRFTGFVTAFDQQYESRDYATVKITATDRLGLLAAQDVVQPYLIVGRGRVGRGRVAGPTSVIPEKTGARVARVLHNIGLTDDQLDLDDGVVTLPLGQGEGKVLEYLNKVTRTEDGRFFAKVDGNLAFRGRYASSLRPEMRDSQGSFGELGVADHFVADLNMAPHLSDVYNHVVINMADGRQMEAEDTESITNDFDRRTYTRDTLLTDAARARGLARHILTRTKNPVPRISKLRFEPEGDPDDLYPAVFARELADRVTIMGTPQGVGTPINQQAHIEGITDEIDIRTKSWIVSWSLSAADLTNYLIVGRGRVGIDRVAA